MIADNGELAERSKAAVPKTAGAVNLSPKGSNPLLSSDTLSLTGGIMGKNYCSVCGARMLRFENPERWICPREAKHVPEPRRGVGRKKGDRSATRNLGRWARRRKKKRSAG